MKNRSNFPGNYRASDSEYYVNCRNARRAQPKENTGRPLLYWVFLIMAALLAVAAAQQITHTAQSLGFSVLGILDVLIAMAVRPRHG